MCPLSHSCGAWFHELAIAHLLWFTVFCRLPRGSRVPAERWTQEVERAPGAALGRAHRSHTVRRSKRLWPVGFGGVCHTALTSRQPTEGPWELQTLDVNFCEHRFLVSEKWPPAPCGPGVTAYGPRREPGLHGRLPVSGDFKKKSFGKSWVQRKGPERPLRTAQDQAPPGMDLKPLPVT